MLLSKNIAMALSTAEPRLALTFRPLIDQISASLIQERLIAQLSGFFGVLGLLLAGIGLYGVTAYAVTSRRKEIGIRLALGARGSQVLRLVLTRTSWLVGIGVLCGAALSLCASRFAAALLYGLKPGDPMTLFSSILVLGIVAGLAAAIPASRAVRTDPASVLREY